MNEFYIIGSIEGYYDVIATSVLNETDENRRYYAIGYGTGKNIRKNELDSNNSIFDYETNRTEYIKNKGYDAGYRNLQISPDALKEEDKQVFTQAYEAGVEAKKLKDRAQKEAEAICARTSDDKYYINGKIDGYYAARTTPVLDEDPETRWYYVTGYGVGMYQKKAQVEKEAEEKYQQNRLEYIHNRGYQAGSNIEKLTSSALVGQEKDILERAYFAGVSEIGIQKKAILIFDKQKESMKEDEPKPRINL